MLKNRSLNPDRPEIWAVGGGKGGTGKSLVAANLAIHLAEMGRRVVLVDADLGGANLHTFLGIDPPQVALGDFIDRRIPSLEEASVATDLPRLRLISGALNRLEVESLKHFQKQRLLRMLVDLPADVVIVDLGAGTSLNVLDFFSIADRGVMVILPEPTSIENYYRFIKAAFRRRLRRLGRALGYQETVESALAGNGAFLLRSRCRNGLDRPREIMEAIATLDPGVARSLQGHLNGFLPFLIVNQARSHSDAALGEAIRVACDQFLGLPIHFAGAVPYDPVLIRTIKSRRALLLEYPRSRTSESFRVAAEEVASVRPIWNASPATIFHQNGERSGRSPYEVLEIPPGSSYSQVITSYTRLRSILRSDSAALLPLDCDAERRAALAEVEHAFRSLSRNGSAVPSGNGPTRLSPGISIG